MPSAPIIRDAHRVLTDKPHMAGTARDRELAEWTRDRFQNAGLEEVAITTHDVLLPWPLEVNVEMTAPRRWRASMREEPVTGECAPIPGTSRRNTPVSRLLRVRRRHGTRCLCRQRDSRGLRLAVGAGDRRPLDYEPYARRIEEFTEEVERRWHRLPGADTPEALANVRDAAA